MLLEKSHLWKRIFLEKKGIPLNNFYFIVIFSIQTNLDEPLRKIERNSCSITPLLERWDELKGTCYALINVKHSVGYNKYRINGSPKPLGSAGEAVLSPLINSGNASMFFLWLPFLCPISFLYFFLKAVLYQVRIHKRGLVMRNSLKFEWVDLPRHMKMSKIV